jgi:hypothetical protein
MAMQVVVRRFAVRTLVGLSAAALFAAGSFAPRCLRAADGGAAIEKGQRVFSAGHSFHMFVPGILREFATAAKIEGHVQVGTQGIGGSRVIQHWDRADDMNAVKKALLTGEVDVLTLSPIYLPDEGIENFVRLALEHNPNVRVLVQEFWLPYDVYNKDYQRKRPEPVDRNARTVEEIRAAHGEYFRDMDEHVAALNKKYEKQAVYVIPAGQAIVALREKIIAGQAPGLKMQNDLFTDAIGHGTAPLRVLVAYCNYAVIYRKSPVGLPVPAALGKGEETEALNKLLQELAWQAAVEHPLSGVRP